MAKRISARGIKKDRLYTYEMAGEQLGVSVQTVRNWRFLGLNVLTNKKPHYILGEALIEFLRKRQEKQSVNLHADQFYCFTCRSPQRPYGMMVDYVPINDVRGRLVSLCEVCEGSCQRFASEASLNGLGEIFAIVRRSARQA
jgi:hypothetical protein